MDVAKLFLRKIFLKEPRNDELYKRLKALVKKTFVVIDEKVKSGEKYNPRTLENISVNENGRLVLLPLNLRDYNLVPDFSIFVSRHLEELSQLPEWIQVVECLHRDEIINPYLKHQIRSPFDVVIVNERNLLYWIIAGSVDEKKPFIFNDDIFNSVYGHMERYFYSETFTRKSICLLLGFDIEVEEINLKEDLRIRRVSKDEIEELWRRSSWFRGMAEFSGFGLPPLKCVLELFTEAPKLYRDAEYSPELEPDLEFDKVISALRLFKRGWVDYPFIIRRASPTLSSSTSFSMKGNKRTIHANLPFGISYRLLKEETEDFMEFYRGIYDKIDCSKIHLKRFNETYTRKSIEDKLIDYMISFESLYLTREEKMEMAYKLAHRVSLLLSKNEKKRKQIFQEMKKAYSLRSNIVHGRKVKKVRIANKEYSFSDFIQIIEEHLRSSIRLFLEESNLSWIDLMFS